MLRVVGKCKSCDEDIPYTVYKYCTICAEKLNKCDKCGNDFKSCREYITDYKAYVDSEIVEYKKMIEDHKNSIFTKKYLSQVAKLEVKYMIFVKFFDNDKPATESKNVTKECLNHLDLIFA